MCVVCERGRRRRFVRGDNLELLHGAVAQLVEHHDGIVGVARSNRVSSTKSIRGFTLGGFVAGEGCFSVSRLSRPTARIESRRRFVFAVEVNERDRSLLEDLRGFIRFGSIRSRPSRSVAWQPTCVYEVNSIKGHLLGTIPFAERYLLPSSVREA